MPVILLLAVGYLVIAPRFMLSRFNTLFSGLCTEQCRTATGIVCVDNVNIMNQVCNI